MIFHPHRPHTLKSIQDYETSLYNKRQASPAIAIFAGWGADETPFKDYQPADSDYMLCYDYRTLDFDASLLKGYKKINVIGWSMGVWAASRVMDKLQETDTSLIIKIV